VPSRSRPSTTPLSLSLPDDRMVSGPGWDLFVNLSDFVSNANVTVKLVNSQVGIAPTLISSAEADVDLATAQEAGSARYPVAFASAPPQHGVADTVLGGVLTLVSPADNPAGA
jgi:hypothetical protein